MCERLQASRFRTIVPYLWPGVSAVGTSFFSRALWTSVNLPPGQQGAAQLGVGLNCRAVIQFIGICTGEFGKCLNFDVYRSLGGGNGPIDREEVAGARTNFPLGFDLVQPTDTMQCEANRDLWCVRAVAEDFF